MTKDTYIVPFPSTGHSARSIMAAAIRRVGFSETCRMLLSPISPFISQPFGSPDRMALQRNLDDIGKTTVNAD